MADYKHDIDRYLLGEMTPAEMNALEKKALYDPFLADALEGAQQLSPEDLSMDLQDLKKSVDKRIDKKNEKPWIWYGRIAAGLLLLTLSTYIIVLVLNRSNEPSDTLALNKQKEITPGAVSPEGPLSKADSVPSQNDNDSSPNLLKEEMQKGELPLPNGSSEPRRQENQPIAAAPADTPKERRADRDEELETTPEAVDISEAVQDQKEIALSRANDSLAPSQALSGDKKSGLYKIDDETDEARKRSLGASKTYSNVKPNSNSDNVKRKIIRGKVTFSEDGMGLPGVNVLVKGSNEGTVTDSQGNYEIPVEQTQPTLLFSFIGFTNEEVIAKSEQLDVQLDADISELSEVVVVGYGADGSSRSAAPAIMELATPEGGRKAFKQYLEKNLQYPELALKNEVEGKVTIQFSIGMTGKLTDFTVIKGIGYGCDDEVIRLIKVGPKWYPTLKNEEPIKDRVRVRMRFALPKK